MIQKITFVSVGVNPDALTRSQMYDVLVIDEPKGLAQLRGENGDRRWFPMIYQPITA